MKKIVFHSRSEADTERLGSALAQRLPSGAVIALRGTLGAGKTRLVQAIAAASGIHRHEVTSPTFVLCHTYRGRKTIHHFDVYRLKDEQEFLELGPEEYFESDALSLVEWAEKVANFLPREYLEIAIEIAGPTERHITLSAHGASFEPILPLIDEHLTSVGVPQNQQR